MNRTFPILAFLFALSLSVSLSSHYVSGQPSDIVIVNSLIHDGKMLIASDQNGAMAFFRKAVALADSAGIETMEIAEIRDRLANYEYYRGNTEIAVGLALRSLGYYEAIGAEQSKIRIMTLIGDILRGNGLFNQSLDYHSRALKQANILNDSSLIMDVYNRMAALGIDFTLIPADSTEKYARISLAIARQQRNEPLIYNNLNILGVLETMRENYGKSMKYLTEAYPIAQKVFPEDEPLILHNMARNYYPLGDKQKAVELDRKALHLAEKLNIPQYIRLASSYLKDHFMSVGNFQEGLKYAIQYYQAKEFIINQKVLVQLKEFNNRMENEQQRRENQRLLYEQKLTNGRLRTFSIIGILLVILLILTTAFIFYQRRQRQEIRMFASRLDESNQVLTRFISILGHDLRSPFNAILGFTEILKNDRTLSNDEREAAIERLYKVSHNTFRLLERILEWSRLQSGSVKPVLKRCDLSVLVRETMHTLEPSALLKKIEIKDNSPGPVEIYADEDMIMTTIRNILSNAIKFSHPGGRIDIAVESGDQVTYLSVNDTGIGITPENIKKLFHLEENYKSQGTSGESGTGLGLILCKEYLAMHGGSIEVSSEKGKGTTITMILPHRR